jgi:hypothetical protein
MAAEASIRMKYLLAAGMFLACATAQAAPRADLWERFAAHEEGNREAISHALFDGFLEKYVKRGDDGINRIPYGRIEGNDRKRLREYLNAMQNVAITKYARGEQRAYWINLYNALTIQIVLDHYPVKSIRDIDISSGWLADGPWEKKLLTIEGERVSLDDIEHRILRPIWKDPRTHYAVNCASLGCPNLAPRAYTASFMEGMLEESARAFVNHPRAAQEKDGLLQVSSLYKWFASDFGGETGVLEHLARYAGPELASELRAHKSLDAYRYDWSLNDLR